MVGQSLALRARAGMFGDRNFRLMWAAATVSAFGYYVTDVAMPLLAIEQLHVTSFEIGLIRVAEQVPSLLFGLFLGVLADRTRKRPLMIWSDRIRAIVLLAVPIAAFRDVLNLPLILVVVFLVGSFNLLFDVSEGSLLPLVIPSGRLVECQDRGQLLVRANRRPGNRRRPGQHIDRSLCDRGHGNRAIWLGVIPEPHDHR